MRGKVHRAARFPLLLCAFVAVFLEINQILDRLIIQLVWYILEQFGECGVYLPSREAARSGEVYIHSYLLSLR